MAKTVFPEWRMPGSNLETEPILLFNSLTGEKSKFLPIEKNKIKWYGCGPTVYDAAHLGHARTYVTFDILRRIFEDYFGYDVNMVMNITDIDDKIIKRAFEQGKDFLEVARYWEAQFFEDMKDLNVKLPTVVTRVSEYVDEIIDFIKVIMEKGYAYESEGSVYFDINAFNQANQHTYARMEPNSVNNESLALEGEGELGIVSKCKKCSMDFALWKAVKPNEPYWSSPWGNGRPGWHIECSTMASSVLGFPIDIHSGGIDLRFPHHDNELAQTEAFYDRPQWVNYFLHSGHLHIHGSKMSKSLKNFLTIRDVLNEMSPRHIRIFCLLHRWDAPVNFNPSTSLEEAVAVDRSFINMFGNVRSRLRSSSMSNKQKIGINEESLLSSLEATKIKVHQSFLDSMNTPEALKALQELVVAINIYLREVNENATILPILRTCSAFIYKILQVFGLCSDSDSFNYGSDVSGATKLDDTIAPFIETIGDFRSNIKSNATKLLSTIKKTSKTLNDDSIDLKDSFAELSHQASIVAKELLQHCDDVRDNKLTSLGVTLEDQGCGFAWRTIPKDICKK